MWTHQSAGRVTACFLVVAWAEQKGPMAAGAPGWQRSRDRQSRGSSKPWEASDQVRSVWSGFTQGNGLASQVISGVSPQTRGAFLSGSHNSL